MVRLGSLLSNKSTFSTVLRQRGSPARFVGVLSVTLALAAIVIAGGLGFSSQKPQTVAPRASSFQSQSETAAVEFIWCGAVTANSARVNARVSPDGSRVRLAISGSADMTAPQFGSLDTALAGINDRVVSLSVNGLTPDTPYHYALEINGILSLDKVGRFQTYPENNASFTFAFASCAWTGSSHQVFDEIRAQDPLFFFHLGDMHYQNISVNDRDVFRNAFQFVLNSATQSALHRSTPIEYIWDDHDYGPNNSDSTARGRQAARLTYREYVPHYPLAERDPFGAIYHSFTIGRARFIVCDARSARSPAGATDDAEKTMLGKTQKAWFKRQLLDARNRGQLIVWANSLPWIGTNGDDGWYRYTHERRELANFIKDSLITRLCMISGDAHMTAIDDGANSDYADGGGAGFPVMHAAPLHRTPSAKGGPYSHGVFLSSSGQFGTMSVTDVGDSITVTWKGWRLKRLLAEYSFSFPMAECPEDYLCGDTDSDGRVDTADVLRLLNFYFRAGTAPCPRAAGDVNCDGLIDLADIVYLIYYVNGAIPTLCCQNTPQDPGSPRLYYPEAKED